MSTDPVLKTLVADADAAEVSIPLMLHLPSGPMATRLHTMTSAGAKVELDNESALDGAIATTTDPEYVHPIVRELTLVDGEDSTSVARVRLSDVAA